MVTFFERSPSPRSGSAGTDADSSSNQGRPVVVEVVIDV